MIDAYGNRVSSEQTNFYKEDIHLNKGYVQHVINSIKKMDLYNLDIIANQLEMLVKLKGKKTGVLSSAFGSLNMTDLKID